MRLSHDAYPFNHHLNDEQLNEIRGRILEGDSLMNIGKQMSIPHHIVCAAAEEIIKELKSPKYNAEITEQEIYKMPLAYCWRLPEGIKAPKDFKGVQIINTFENSN